MILFDIRYKNIKQITIGNSNYTALTAPAKEDKLVSSGYQTTQCHGDRIK